MDPARHDRLTELFLAARSLGPEARNEFLDEQCGSDDTLRAEINNLLAHDREASRFLDRPIEVDRTTVTESSKSQPTDQEKTEGLGSPALSGQLPNPVPGYTTVREIGHGGYGYVFEAHDHKLDRRVALKILSKLMTGSDQAKRRFRREAWITGRLTHPSIVKVFDRGDTGEVSYFSMELVTGGSLHDVIRNLRAQGKDEHWGIRYRSRDYVTWAVGIVREAASALDYAHGQGVVHRDVKPTNLLLDGERGDIKVVDFGVATQTDLSRMTADGQMLGTLSYMAPEQFRARPEEIDRRCDIYALGVTLFELLTLQLPYKGDNVEQFVKSVVTDAPRRPRALNELVSQELETVIRTAIEKEPEDRYQSAAEFAEDLDNVLNLRPIQKHSPGPVYRTWKWVRRKPMHATLVGGLVVGVPAVATLVGVVAVQRQTVRNLEIDELWQEARRLVREARHGDLAVLATTILRKAPKHVEARRARGISYWNLALQEKNPLEVERFRELSLEDLTRLIELRPDDAWPYRLKAEALGQFGQDSESVRLQDKARELGSGTPSDDDLRFDAERAFETADYARALGLLDQLCGRRPNWAPAFELRGLTHEELGNPDAAIADLRLAVALAQDNPDYRHAIGRLLTDQGALIEGQEHLRKAQELAPEMPEAHEAMAGNLIQQGKGVDASTEEGKRAALRLFRRAEDQARRALELLPDLAWSHVNLGSGLAEQYRLLSDPDLISEAIGHYEYVVEKGPHQVPEEAHAVAVLNLCDGLIQTSRYEQAIGTCRQVVELNPTEPVAYYNLAGALALTGRIDEAFWALEQDYELGDLDWEYLQEDPWLESLHDDPRFRDLIVRMKEGAGEGS